MPFSREEATKKMNGYLELLDRLERLEYLELAGEWGRISKTLSGLVTNLSELSNLSENQLFQLELYKTFLEDSRVVITTYNQIAEGIITDEQAIFARLGLKQSQELLGVRLFNKLNFEDVKFMIGNTKEGTPLFNLLQESYPQTVEKITSTLIDSMALGRNPLETARLLYQDMDGNLSRARLISRTEQMNVLWNSQKMQYQQSGLVKEWEWIAESDACSFCQSMDGKRFPLEININEMEHPQGRCGMLPIL
jgi:hypothetical protein